ncbi:hypothetical protein [Streptomyces sp. VRA16 Mangrove soil]|uniref:hypothetical protein n=1 Tax=Streptomyces sp. VRA16 Mangrove soil TaxID=2817434 RepID=UPI001A9F8033|nr:hypothetical protein [Streptomyces sp. VRA16 Mangrove soil]MBO1334752.1 hypothetical protein [Streptomyces sp. VRA16 Mangrove soil]
MTATPSSAHVPAASSGAAVDRVRPARAVMGLVTALGPLLFILAFVFEPYALDADDKGMVRGIAQHPGQMKGDLWIWLVASLVLTAAVLIVGVYAMARSPKLGLAGTLLFGGGVILINGTPSTDVVTLSGLEKGLRQPTLVTLQKGIESLPQVNTAVALFIVGHVLGSILLGVVLLRSGAVPAWAAWATILAMPANVAGWMTGVEALAVVGFALLTVGFTMVGLSIARNGTGWVRGTSAP